MTAPVSVWRRWRASHRQIQDLHLQVDRLTTETYNLGRFLRDARAKQIAAEQAVEDLTEELRQGRAQLAAVRRIAADQSTTPADAPARIMAALMEGEAPEPGGDRG